MRGSRKFRQRGSGQPDKKALTNVTILSIFRTHAQKEYRKVLEMKGTYILHILVLLLFENMQRIY